MTVRLHFPVSAHIRTAHSLLEAGRPGLVDVPIRYGIIEHPDHGPVLIDTGYTSALWTTKGWSLACYRRLMSPRLEEKLTPTAALARLGYTPADVKHVIVTHLHADHICGLGAFAHATFHLSRATAQAWQSPRKWGDVTEGVFPALLPPLMQWRAMEDARRVPLQFLDASETGYSLFDDDSVVLVDLDGHLGGHIGVVVRTATGPVLYAVDASWTRHGYREGCLPPAPLKWIISSPAQVLAACAKVNRAEALGWPVVLCHDPQPTPWDLTEARR